MMRLGSVTQRYAQLTDLTDYGSDLLLYLVHHACDTNLRRPCINEVLNTA